MTDRTESPKPLTREEHKQLMLSLAFVETAPLDRVTVTIPLDVAHLWMRWSREMEARVTELEAERDALPPREGLGSHKADLAELRLVQGENAALRSENERLRAGINRVTNMIEAAARSSTAHPTPETNDG